MTVIDTHLHWLTFKGRSPRTVDARGAVLRRMEEAQGPILGLNEGDLLEWLSRPGLQAESRRAYRSHVRGFYEWALERELIPEDPAAKIPTVKVPRRLPDPISPSDLKLALANADARMYAWLILGALAGLRCMEIAGLCPGDIYAPEDGGMPLLMLRHTKGGGSGIVPAHPLILAALAALPVYSGKWWDVSPKYVSQEIGNYLHSLGIRASAHKLRHHAGTAWLRASGHDILTTAALLRHASVATTMSYAQLDPTRPSEVVALTRLAG